MRVLLISPYHTGSHRQWAAGYAASSQHDIEIVSHVGQFWKWRLLGGAVTLSADVRRHVEVHGKPDVVLATSMTDLASLLGLSRPALDGVGAALFMHENQLTYPATGRTAATARHGLVTWSALRAADAVAFNSAFHRDSVFEALPGFLRSFPEHDHVGLVDDVRAKSVVLPVGVQLPGVERSNPSASPMIVWNHRWDPDKQPEVFLNALLELSGEGVDFEVALLGERFVNQGADYQHLVDRLGKRVVVAQHLDEDSYGRVLAGADIVVSTAVQEFFGVSIVEAMWHGALPILPDRLVYPERIPEHHRDVCLYGSDGELVDRLRWALAHTEHSRAIASELRSQLVDFGWELVAPRYDSWLESITGA